MSDPTQGLQIILAAAQHDIQALRVLLRDGSANFQDAETGFAPLHAAIAACEDNDSVPRDTNGANDIHINGNAPSSEAFQDKNNETPGCLALRAGFQGLYEVMVDAGVRAEMLLNRMDEYEALSDSDDEVGESEALGGQTLGPDELESTPSVQDNSVPEETDSPNINDVTLETNVRNEDYLQASLRFQNGRILDDSGNAVMMAWETDIMKKSADLICPEIGLRVLNIGHGLGITDALFQEKSPSIHHIIEAHPAVLERMRKDGWYDKSNVTVHEGRWQDVIPKIVEHGMLFDAVYFDTFAEDYKAFRDFFSDNMLGLLEDKGKWSFFHGLGADRQICYDVYSKVVEMDLFEAGFDTDWETLGVPESQEIEWQGVKGRYWALKEYKLPICSFIA
ncbi:uncharacterized protein KY384_002555 [Bacidia gigantensis]|uniref:uncharacterized protein n=1 Tax=Bacidia gigantensis TaxID=2732470 RepID=UPI001D046E3D|nr:uncharacterized protein KY384_002555 [Bacidia gigantensis]KAG8532678.1 hypothetical protein KY384_002555 [Bacidia gigantensis]